MTPKEKAIELVERFDETLTYLESKAKTKQCALICVDWHLKEFIDTYGDDLIDNISYWEEVKQEIKKL